MIPGFAKQRTSELRRLDVADFSDEWQPGKANVAGWEQLAQMFADPRTRGRAGSVQYGGERLVAN